MTRFKFSEMASQKILLNTLSSNEITQKAYEKSNTTQNIHMPHQPPLTIHIFDQPVSMA